MKKPTYVNESGIKIPPIKVKLERTTTEKYRWAITVLGNFENEVMTTINSLNRKLAQKYSNKK